MIIQETKQGCFKTTFLSKSIWALIGLVFCCVTNGFAQKDTTFNAPSSLRTKTILKLKSDTLQLDSLTILPQTLKIVDSKTRQSIPDSLFQVQSNQIVWKQKPTQSIMIQYRVLPYNLSKSNARKDTAWIGIEQIGGNIPSKFKYNPFEENNGLNRQNLNYTGAFARGISFGNNQDLVLNSSFNLQMAGTLGNDVEIVAAISDNNIPLQPEGNTQQLNEFDRIFIQLRKGKTALTAGDYELRRPEGYFLNYYKKLQGLTFETQTNLFKKGTLSTTASAAISRGKFGRNTLPIQEGNQGPYKLRGNEGELFIIVLAGTEKVFIDGRLVQRGQDADYIINYNRGEITFTPNRLITKDVRVQVEFEYTDQDYQRSLYAINTHYEQDKFKVHLNIFSEQDGRTPTIQGELSQLQQAALAEIPDDVGSAFITGIDTAAFNQDRILYKMVDSLVNGILYDSVLVYSTSRDSAKFEARFTEVGSGNGNYIRLQSAANGAVFGWVAPDPVSGQPRGTHAPIFLITAPIQQQLYAVGADYQISKNSKISAEFALSNRDLNRLSNQNSGNNLGGAAKLYYENQMQIGKDSIAPLSLTIKADYEVIQENFNPINPYRRREFTRDWNTTNLPATEEHIAKASLILQKSKYGSVQYQFSTFLKDSLYTGIKHLGVLNFNRNGLQGFVEANFLTTDGLVGKTQFFRPRFEVTKRLKTFNNWRVGIYGEREQNRQFIGDTDSLQASSFFYDMFRVFAESPQKNDFTFRANYVQRLDYAPLPSDFEQNTQAEEFNFNGTWAQSKRSNLQFNLTYRNLNITDTSLTNLEPQETYLGRIEYNLSLKRGWLRANTLYEIGSGQEQKIQYNYIEVEAGQGLFSWIDRNQDSIKQLDEFEIAVFQDQADHIRVTSFTDEFIRSNTVRFNQSLALNPKAIWFNKKGFKRILSKFSTQSAWQILRKVRDVDGVSPWNPFQLAIPDTSLVSLTSNIRNALFFNRTDPKFSVELGSFTNRNRVVLTSGFESRGRTESYFRLRWNITKTISSQWYAALGTNENDSEIFNNRDYIIDFLKFEPKLSFFFLERTLRAELSYEYKNSENTINEQETALANEGKVEITFNRVSKSSYRLNFSLVDVNFTGVPNTPVEFTMLEGLKNGQNYLWNFTFDRRLAKNVQLSVSYEGRKTGVNRTIHVGRAQVRANF